MLFHDAIHQSSSFVRNGRTNDRAALLLHGYMGSPAELRALGEALSGAGIRADAPALPGFGPEIDRLAGIDEEDWIDTAATAWSAIREASSASVLIGFSMGGAIALAVAAEMPPSRLILIEPFQRIPDWRARLLPYLGLVLREIKPLRNRQELGRPISSLQALARIGKAGVKAAPRVACPTLIIQARPYAAEAFGHPDTLNKSLGGPTRVEWVDGGHQLVRDNRPSWPHVRDLVVDFALGQETSA